MWIEKGNKAELLNVIEHRDRIKLIKLHNSYDINKYINSSELLFIWTEHPSLSVLPLPNAIIVSPNHKNDFLAWTSTYINQFRPFTAYCRILSLDQFSHYYNMDKEDNKQTQLINMCIGLIIGETITNYNLNQKLSYQLAKSSYSYIFSQMLLNKNYTNLSQDILLIIKRLEIALPRLRRLVVSDDLIFIWNIISQLTTDYTLYFDYNNFNKRDDFSFISDAISDIKDKNEISYHTLHNYVSQINVLNQISNNYNEDSREFKVASFEKIINHLIGNKDISPNVKSFISAYLVSQIAPGSLKYINLLLPYIKELPSILLWYGFLEGINNNFQINDFDDGYGWRISRDISRSPSIYERPDCDISLDELEIYRINNNLNFIKNINTENKNFMRIEIIPSVTFNVELVSDNKREMSGENHKLNFNYIEQIDFKLKELLNFVQSLKEPIQKTKQRKQKK